MSERPRILRFGVFEVDSSCGELRRNGTKIKLQQQPFQVLLMLLTRAPDLVTREELRKELWPEDTFVDFEHSVNAAIKRLRDALGDSAYNSRFVETIAGRGYRFLLPVETKGEPQLGGVVGKTDLPAAGRISEKPNVSKRTWFVLGALLLVAAGSSLFWFRHNRTATAPPLARVTERRLTSNSAEFPILNAVISPDGKYLAYSDLNGTYIKQIETADVRPVPLPADFTAVVSDWFPDSTHLLLTRWIDNRTPSLWRVSILGGSAQQLTADGLEGSVSPDGGRIIFLRRGGAFDPARSPMHRAEEMWLMSATGEDAHLLSNSTDLHQVGSEFGPASWSPDGSKIAYVNSYNIASKTRDRGALYANGGQAASLIISDDQGHQLSFPMSPRIGPLCWRGNDRLIYSQHELNDRDGSVWLTSVDARSGILKGAPHLIEIAPGWITALSLNREQSKLVLARTNLESQTYIADFNKDGKKLTNLRRLTYDLETSFDTAWLPDSITVLFTSNRNGLYDIFRQRIDSTAAELLISSPHSKILPRLSPDGTSVLYNSMPDRERSDGPKFSALVWMKAPVDGGPPSVIWSTRNWVNLECARAPSKLCVTTRDPGPETTDFVALDLFHGNNKLLFAVPNALVDRWSVSPDGSRIALAKTPDQSRIRFFSIETGGWHTTTVKGEYPLFYLVWSADGKTLLVPSVAKDGTSVLLQIDESGTARELLRADKGVHIGPTSQSPDGHHIAIREIAGDTNVWMLEDF